MDGLWMNSDDFFGERVTGRIKEVEWWSGSALSFFKDLFDASKNYW